MKHGPADTAGMLRHERLRSQSVRRCFFSPFCRQWRATRAGHPPLLCPTNGGILPAFERLSRNRPSYFRVRLFFADWAIEAAFRRRTIIGTWGLRELVRIFRVFQRQELCARFPHAKCSNGEVLSASRFHLAKNSFSHAATASDLLQS